MRRLVAAICTGLLGVLGGLSASGCGSATQRESAAPDAASGATGTLVVRVAGHPRDIRYFIDGEHYEPDEEIEWWRDARLEVELEPGSYRVEAEYLVRAFAGEGETYRIATPEPVVVHAGQVTLLYARIEKDYRGIPKRETEVFSVLHPSSQADDDSLAPQGALEGETTAVEGEAMGVKPHGVASEAIWIRNGNVRFEAAQTWTPPAGRSIQVSGSRVTASDDPLAPPAVQRDEKSRITIRRSRVSQSFEPAGTAAVSEPETSTENLRIRATLVERGVAVPAPLVDPNGGSAFRIRGTQVHQESAPSGDVAPAADAAPEAIHIRGQRVSRSAAPPATEPPGADAAVGSIRIRGTQVDESAAPAAPSSPQP